MKAKTEHLKRRNGEEAFLESVLSGDGFSKRTLLDVLSELSVELPRPKKLKDREFIEYAAARILRQLSKKATTAGDALLHFIHGGAPSN